MLICGMVYDYLPRQSIGDPSRHGDLADILELAQQLLRKERRVVGLLEERVLEQSRRGRSTIRFT